MEFRAVVTPRSLIIYGSDNSIQFNSFGGIHWPSKTDWIKNISEDATHLHAHVNVSVRGGNQILTEVQLLQNLNRDIDNSYRDGEKYWSFHDEFVRVTWPILI